MLPEPQRAEALRRAPLPGLLSACLQRMSCPCNVAANGLCLPFVSACQLHKHARHHSSHRLAAKLHPETLMHQSIFFRSSWRPELTLRVT